MIAISEPIDHAAGKRRCVAGLHTLLGVFLGLVAGWGDASIVAAQAHRDGINIQPELPREFLDTSMPSITGATINVAEGGDLQGALDAARSGDLILLAAGATFTGNFALRAKTGTGWIVIRTDTNLPAEGVRMTPAAATNLATIRSSVIPSERLGRTPPCF